MASDSGTSDSSTSDFNELFPFDEEPAGLKIYARVTRERDFLKVEYRLGGERSCNVAVPELNRKPGRRDQLWEKTCFEVFFAESGRPWYWEANLSPSLDWELYHFRGYREGRKPETRVKELRGELLPQNSAGLGFLLTINTSGLFTHRASIDLGLSAVIEWQGGKQSFWALSHAGPKPDFHQRKSFVLQPA